MIRTVLFVPGDRPERFEKAIATGAGRVVIDLEDAVEPQHKDQARENADRYLAQTRHQNVMVRINSNGDEAYKQDLALCRAHPHLAGVIVPKAESLKQLEEVADTCRKIWPLIETPQGLLTLPESATCKGIERLVFGVLDLAIQLGINAYSPSSHRIFDQVRYALLLHSALNGLEPPVDTVYPVLSDMEGLSAFATASKDLGFAGMLCLHPKQVEQVDSIFTPSAHEQAWAERVLEAAKQHGGAFSFEGRMIDAPVLTSARRMLGK
jgi:(S)-citramalyl-CoA lyase